MKRKFWRKKLMAMTVLMSLLLSATGCSEDPDAQTSSTKSSGSGDSWVYLLVSVRKRSGK